MADIDEKLDELIAGWAKTVHELHKLGVKYTGDAPAVMATKNLDALRDLVEHIEAVTDSLIIAGNIYSKQISAVLSGTSVPMLPSDEDLDLEDDFELPPLGGKPKIMPN